MRIITIVDANGRMLRRIRREPDGREFILIDNRYDGPRDSFSFMLNMPPPVIRMPRERYIVDADRADRALLYETLIAPPVMHIDRRYTLDEIRYTQFLRERMPRIDLDTITFETGSWDVTPDQARLLEPIGEAMLRAVRRNPNEVYLIEGHTDAVGNDVDNLSLFRPARRSGRQHPVAGFRHSAGKPDDAGLRRTIPQDFRRRRRNGEIGASPCAGSRRC